MKSKKSNPIPTRFDDGDADFLISTMEKTGMTRAEIIRRGVRLLRKYAARGEGFSFLIDLAA